MQGKERWVQQRRWKFDNRSRKISTTTAMKDFNKTGRTNTSITVEKRIKTEDKAQQIVEDEQEQQQDQKRRNWREQQKYVQKDNIFLTYGSMETTILMNGPV